MPKKSIKRVLKGFDVHDGDALIVRKIIEFQLLSVGFLYQEFKNMSDADIMFNFMILCEMRELEAEKIQEANKRNG